jgi:hypothetical protein
MKIMKQTNQPNVYAVAILNVDAECFAEGFRR